MRKFLLTVAALAAAVPALASGDRAVVVSGGQIRALPSGDTLQVNAPTTGNASINLPHGTAPTSPVNGDCWTTTTGLYCRVNGTTVGPMGAGGGGLSDGDKGDITISGTGTTWNIDAGTIGTAELGADVTAAGEALLDDADAAAQRATLGLGSLATQGGTFSGTSSGTNTGDQDLSSYATTVAVAAGFQPLDADLTSIAALTTTAFGRGLLDDADAAAGRTSLGLGTLATQSGTFSGTSSGTNTGDQTITLTGHVTGTGIGSFGTTIASNVVTNTMLAQVATATFKGRTSAATGNVEDLTATQATALLNTMGAASSGAGGSKGLVPAPATGDQTKFLRGDAAWVTIAGNVTGAASSVDLEVPLFSGTGGTTLLSSAGALRALSSSATHSDGTNALVGSLRYFIGNGTPSIDDSGLIIGRSLTGSYSQGAHGVRDESQLGFTGTGLIAYASYDAIPRTTGSLNWNHLHSFQARPEHAATGTNSEVAGFTMQANQVAGAGTIDTLYGMRMMDTQGSGTINTQAALWVDNLTRGTSNYALYSAGSSVASYHAGLFQFGTAPKISASGFTTYGAIVTHSNDGTVLTNPNATLINGVISLADATTNRLLAAGTTLDLASTPGQITLSMGGVEQARFIGSQNLGLGLTAVGTSGTKTLAIADGVAPSTNVTGVQINSISGELVARDSSGVVTNLTNPFTSTLGGIVPASGGGTTTFVRADGTWAAPAIASVSGLGTSVATALAVNVGSAGAPVTFNGALGTPSSGTLTNATGLPESGVTNLVSDLALKAPLASPVFTGVMYWQQGAPTAKTTTGTLTIAELLTGLITVTSASAVSLTLPTGTLTDAGVLAGLAVDRMFDWYSINLGSSTGAMTLVAGTAHTIVGSVTCAISTTCHWGTRKTATNTFVTYRLG